VKNLTKVKVLPALMFKKLKNFGLGSGRLRPFKHSGEWNVLRTFASFYSSLQRYHQPMILVISGTNRENSRSELFARYAYEYLQQKAKETVAFLSLTDLPLNMYHNHMYDGAAQQAMDLSRIQDELVVPADKWYFVMPEYNGSFPGILKLFVDALSIRKYKETFYGKKAALLGVAGGRAGNLRGMEHFTGVLNYLQVTVMPNRLPVSSIEKLISPEGLLVDQDTMKAIQAQLDAFLNF
jgi:NAD(P)H-dependent FMN reductase